MSEVSIDEAHDGLSNERRDTYEPTYIRRGAGVIQLFLEVHRAWMGCIKRAAAQRT